MKFAALLQNRLRGSNAEHERNGREQAGYKCTPAGRKQRT